MASSSPGLGLRRRSQSRTVCDPAIRATHHQESGMTNSMDEWCLPHKGPTHTHRILQQTSHVVDNLTRVRLTRAMLKQVADNTDSRCVRRRPNSANCQDDQRRRCNGRVGNSRSCNGNAPNPDPAGNIRSQSLRAGRPVSAEVRMSQHRPALVSVSSAASIRDHGSTASPPPYLPPWVKVRQWDEIVALSRADKVKPVFYGSICRPFTSTVQRDCRAAGARGW